MNEKAVRRGAHRRRKNVRQRQSSDERRGLVSQTTEACEARRGKDTPEAALGSEYVNRYHFSKIDQTPSTVHLQYSHHLSGEPTSIYSAGTSLLSPQSRATARALPLA